MARKCSGLRHRHRPRGRSTYHRTGKAARADYYGEWERGLIKTPERIAKTRAEAAAERQGA